MAPIGDRRDRQGSMDTTKQLGEGETLWAEILSEVQTSATNKLPSFKNLVIIGDNDSGKTSLVAKFQGNEDLKKGMGLEYHYLDVKDEIRDDQTRLSTWILDGDPHHAGLLKYCLSEETFEHTLLLLVVSMSQPWAVVDGLRRWSSILRDHIELLRIDPIRMKELEQSLVTYFQDYTEPSEESSHSQSQRRETNPLHPQPSSTDDDKVILPLGETTLTKNLGIPIVVVVTKSDAISTLEKEHDYREEHFDFIQQYIRKFCLNYGASLCYTSVKEGKNIDLLHKYMLHRIYGFPFTTSALVVERDAVFIPAGWDNEKKISILYENMTSMKPDDPFEDVLIKPPTRKPIQRDLEVLAEDEQTFLMKQQMQLSKTPAPGGTPRQDSPLRSAGGSPRVSGSPGTGAGLTASPKKADGARAGGATNEGVLANFFNSLLSKKTGAGGAAPGAGGVSPTIKTDKAAVTRDAAAELDRMTRAKKPITQISTTTNDSQS
ncbi:cytoplasmic dynein 1 light intermediate chain 2-like isoform X2 [Tubulanus polymorphus]|uniref:cytoplasmic dynein 1 light intermediate chain 2-like isoform X2 n=1 Tax=Tubulanus polymorphus TaxID=672921 RepID=UPI003DA56073